MGLATHLENDPVVGEEGVDLAIAPGGDRNAAFLQAAYDLLDEDGLEGLTIRGVLAKTSLSRRAFYERFAGKDDLVLAVFEQTIRAAADYFAASVAGLADPMARMEHIVVNIVIGQESPIAAASSHGNRRGAALSREHLRLAESRPADLEKALSPLLGLMAQIVSDGIDAGQMRAGPPQMLAALVYNLVSTTVHAELLAEEEEATPRPRQELAHEIWEFCRRALAA